jgi:tetratricopeptide (TPR) repeat protein
MMPQAALPFNLSVIALIMFQGVRLHSDGGCRTRQGKASMFNRTQLVVCSFLVAFFLVGCRVNAPEKGSEAINLMTRYNQEGRHDDALKVAQDWLKKHPEQHAHLAAFYDQIAITYLVKASKDRAHKDEWIQEAVAYYDEDLSAHQNDDIHVEFFTVGHGFERAGDLSTADSCLYYKRAVKAFEEEKPFIQADSYTLDGKTFRLEPLRQENDKALERVKLKFGNAGCK